MLRFPGSKLCPQGFEGGFSEIGVLSFVHHRGVSRGLLGDLGILGDRSVGRGGPPLRLLDPFSSSSFSLDGSNSPSPLFPVVHQGNRVERCIDRLDCEGSCRTFSFDSGLLQPTVGSPKVSGGWRPVIDLSRLNRSVLVSHFHMETVQLVPQSLRLGDWMVSLDLQDTYPQVPVHPSSRHYLRFCVGNSMLQFCVLCFGLSAAPHVSTRVMAPISSVMHQYGFRILPYLNDWLVLGSSFRDVVRARDFLLSLCQELGVRVNLAKSSLDPSQTLDYLGMRLRHFL